MPPEDLANVDGEQSTASATTAATEQSDKVETTAKDDTTTEATTETGDKPGAATTEDAEAKAASEAGKALNKHKQTASERVQQAITRQREAEREAKRAWDRVAQLEGKSKPPNADEYTDPAKLTADQISHALNQQRIQDLKDEGAEANDEAQKARAIAWHERSEAFKAENPDIDLDKIASEARYSEATSMMIADMDEGPAVLVHFGKNPAEARRIEGLPERQRAFELGKIVAQITSPPPRRVTTAPNPVETTAGKSGGGSGFDPAKASVEEYSALYRKNFKQG